MYENVYNNNKFPWKNFYHNFDIVEPINQEFIEKPSWDEFINSIIENNKDVIYNEISETLIIKTNANILLDNLDIDIGDYSLSKNNEDIPMLYKLDDNNYALKKTVYEMDEFGDNWNIVNLLRKQKYTYIFSQPLYCKNLKLRLLGTGNNALY